jgi:hypothetical protein
VSGRTLTFWTPLAAAAFAAGAVLRLWNLRDQVLGGDETHAIRAALNFSLSKILVTYQQTDNCIPLTALDKLFMLAKVPLTEMILRLPVLFCGLAALFLLPWAFSRAFASDGRKETISIFRFLLAISPVLTLYSRIARSYMPLVLLSSTAVMAFYSWWRSRGLKSGFAYVVFGALALWFHLAAGPIVAAPFLFALGETVAKVEDRRRNLRDLVFMGLAMAATCLVFLFPALESLVEVITSKHVDQSIPWRSLLPALLELQAGTGYGWLALLFGLAALAGLVRLFRAERRLALFTATVVAGHAIGLLILSPFGLANPVICARYLLPVLPFVLLWVAAAFGLPWRQEAKGRVYALQGAAGAAFVLALLAAGPFADPATWRTSFLHHNDFVAFYKPRPQLPAGALPDFYRGLHGETLVEFPWTFLWEANRSFYLYQQVHGGRVIVSTPQRLLYQPPLALRNAVAPEPAAICRSGARYLVVHRAVAREEDVIAAGAESEIAPPFRRMLREEGTRLGDRLRKEWGAPLYADPALRAWDLRAACGAPHAPIPAASASAATASPATKLPGR